MANHCSDANDLQSDVGYLRFCMDGLLIFGTLCQCYRRFQPYKIREMSLRKTQDGFSLGLKITHTLSVSDALQLLYVCMCVDITIDITTEEAVECSSDLLPRLDRLLVRIGRFM